MMLVLARWSGFGDDVIIIMIMTMTVILTMILSWQGGVDRDRIVFPHTLLAQRARKIPRGQGDWSATGRGQVELHQRAGSRQVRLQRLEQGGACRGQQGAGEGGRQVVPRRRRRVYQRLAGRVP